MEASGGAFGHDFELILGSMLGSRAPYAIFAKISHSESTISEVPGGSKKMPKWLRKQLPATTWLQERLGSLWGSILNNFGVHFELPHQSKNDTENNLHFKRVLEPLEIRGSEKWVVIWRGLGLRGPYFGGGY